MEILIANSCQIWLSFCNDHIHSPFNRVRKSLFPHTDEFLQEVYEKVPTYTIISEPDVSRWQFCWEVDKLRLRWGVFLPLWHLLMFSLRSLWSLSWKFQTLSCKLLRHGKDMLIHCRLCCKKWLWLGQLTERYPWAGDLSKVNERKQRKAYAKKLQEVKLYVVCHFLSPYFWHYGLVMPCEHGDSNQALGGRNMVRTRIGRKPRSCWEKILKIRLRVGCMMSESHLFSFYIRMEPLFAAWNGAGRPPKSWELGNFVLKWAVQGPQWVHFWQDKRQTKKQHKIRSQQFWDIFSLLHLGTKFLVGKEPADAPTHPAPIRSNLPQLPSPSRAYGDGFLWCRSFHSAFWKTIRRMWRMCLSSWEHVTSEHQVWRPTGEVGEEDGMA